MYLGLCYTRNLDTYIPDNGILSPLSRSYEGHPLFTKQTKLRHENLTRTEIMKAIMILGAVLIMIGMKTAAADSEWLENLTPVFIISGIAVGLVGLCMNHNDHTRRK